MKIKKPAIYHLMVIVDANDSTYNDAFLEGVKEAGESLRVASEIVLVDGNRYNEKVIEKLEMASYAKVDGLVVQSVNSEAFVRKVNEVVESGIPVFLLGEDITETERVSYIGVNRYNIGHSAGVMLADIMDGKGKIAIIDHKAYGGDKTLSLGLSDVFMDHEDISIELVTYTQQGALNSETIATQIFRNYPQIDGIFCTNSQNTLGVAQAMIDNNVVNDFTLIGFGDDVELLEYIEKGKIAKGTIVADYKDIGYKAITVFSDYKSKDFVSSVINTTVHLVSEDTIGLFLDERGE